MRRVRDLRGGDKFLGELPHPSSSTGWAKFPIQPSQSLFDLFFPKGMQWYWRADFVKERSDEAIDAHIVQAPEHTERAFAHASLSIDGAVRRVGKGDTALNTRDATWSMVIAGIDPNPQKAGEITRWTKGYWKAVHHYSADGPM